MAEDAEAQAAAAARSAALASSAPQAAAGAGSHSIEVVYAAPDRVWRVQLELPVGATAGQALAASGFARLFPDYAPCPPMLGVYGRNCTAEHVLDDGDRLEIYRPLDFDPQESRRRRAAHRRQKAG